MDLPQKRPEKKSSESIGLSCFAATLGNRKSADHAVCNSSARTGFLATFSRHGADPVFGLSLAWAWIADPHDKDRELVGKLATKPPELSSSVAIQNLLKTGLLTAAQLEFVVNIGQAVSRYSTPTDKSADRSG